MKLWLLGNREDLEDDRDTNPWSPWYDKAFGFVVRAETEEQARQLATDMAGQETRKHKDAWLDAQYSTCVELAASGDASVILRDFASA